MAPLLWKLSYQAMIIQWKGKFATFWDFCSQSVHGMDRIVLAWLQNFPLLMNHVGLAPNAKGVLKYINITSLFALFFVRFGFVSSRTSLHGPCRRVPTYTASITITETERSWVRDIHRNVVIPAFPFVQHRFIGTPFPCINIYGNDVPMHSRPTIPLVNSPV